MNHEARFGSLIHFFETLTPESIGHMPSIYAANAYFKDPFNEVIGLPSIEPIFRHMFQQVEEPRFVVTTSMLQGDEAFMTWNFLFRMKRFSREEQCIRGASHLHFDSEGLVRYHRDYWDVAEELYEKLPVLGSLMRLLKCAGKK